LLARGSSMRARGVKEYRRQGRAPFTGAGTSLRETLTGRHAAP
jgi:hypothetical protein